MSHCNDYEIRDIFGYEDSGFNHFLDFQDGKHALESVTFSDSHKKPRYDAVNDVKTSIYYEDPATVPTLTRKDCRVLPSAPKEESSNILDLSLSEKTALELGLTKCSTGSTILDFQGAKLSTNASGEDENGTGNTTLCSECSFPGKRGVVHHKKHCDISSVNAFATVSTNEQRDGEDDLEAYGCPNIRDFDDFDIMFRNPGSTFAQGNSATEEEISWFSSTTPGLHGFEDTLQSVVLPSVSESSAFNNISSSHGLCVNTLPAIELSAINTETSFGTRCSPLPMYPDTEWKGKSECVDAGIVEKSLAFEHIGYGNEYRDPNMINMNIKELYTTTEKKINSTLSTLQSSFCGCGLIQNVQNPELHSSILSAHQTCSLQPILKHNFLSETYASNYLHPYNLQAQPSDIVKLEHLGPTLNSVVIHSSSLLDYVTPNNQSSLPGFFPIEKNNKIHARQKFAAAFIMDKPLTQHAAVSDTSVQRKYKSEDEVEGDKKPVYASGNLSAVNMGSSCLQDNSCMASTFIDDASLKSANIRQLQMITDRLGARTKLCIRDSLYRLARSAEQSRYYDTADNVSSESSPMIGLQGARYSKSPAEILGVSINTNAIERSVACLLFHKSLELEHKNCS